MNSGDLLTTCASSGATLVAIIGGFLLTRYMSVESEIRGADRVVGQAQGRLKLADSRVEKARHQLADYDLDDAFNADVFIDGLYWAVDRGHDFTIKTARDLLGLERFEDVDIERRIRAWTAEMVRAHASDVWLNFPRTHAYPVLDEFVQNRVEIAIEPIWERIYETLKESQRAERGSMQGFQMDDFGIRDLDAPRRSSFENRLHDAVVFREAVAAEVRMAESSRASIAKPDGLQWEVIVLLIVAVLTIVPSLLLLAPKPADLNRAESCWVVGSFLAGFALLIGYLLRHASLVRKSWDENPPIDTETRAADG